MWNLTGRFLQCNVGAEFRDTVFNRWWVVVRKILCYVIAKCNNGWMSTHFLSPWPFTFDLFESKPITDQYSSTSSCQPNSVTYYIVVVVWLICRTEACGHSSEKMNAKCRQLCRELKWLLEEQITIKMYPCASMFPYHEDQFKCVCVFFCFSFPIFHVRHIPVLDDVDKVIDFGIVAYSQFWLLLSSGSTSAFLKCSELLVQSYAATNAKNTTENLVGGS